MNYKLEYFQNMRARKKERGECFYCNKPAVTKSRCEYHRARDTENHRKLRTLAPSK